MNVLWILSKMQVRKELKSGFNMFQNEMLNRTMYNTQLKTWLIEEAFFPNIMRCTFLNLPDICSVSRNRKNYMIKRTRNYFLWSASKSSIKGEQLFPSFLYLHYKVSMNFIFRFTEVLQIRVRSISLICHVFFSYFSISEIPLQFLSIFWIGFNLSLF